MIRKAISGHDTSPKRAIRRPLQYVNSRRWPDRELREACVTLVASMTVKPLDLTLEVAPKARFDVVELRSRFAAEHEALAAYSHCLYWSSHTTAGFLDRSISTRLSTQHVST